MPDIRGLGWSSCLEWSCNEILIHYSCLSFCLMSHSKSVILSTENNMGIEASPKPGLPCPPSLLATQVHFFLTDDM